MPPKTDFIGRKKELAAMEERYRERKSHLVVIYGRRRVGKSALIRHFSTKKRSLFHVGDRSTKELQIQKFLATAAEAFQEPLFRDLSITDWHKLFETITPHFIKHKTLLILDEFQWMCEAAPELPSILQQFWDKTWEKSGHVFLILCGSYMGFMEREVLGQKSPLFGRRTAQIHLKPFSYLEAREFHPQYPPEEVARAYMICGGIPAYLLAFQDTRSIEENVLKECLEDAGRLREEPRFLTMEELREPAVYFSLLQTLHTHQMSITELGKSIGIEKGNLVYYLNTLQELGYVEKVLPLGTTAGSLARVRYRIRDSLLRFWFTLVYPFLNDLTQRPTREVLLDKVKPRLDAFFGAQFEGLCREAMPHLLTEKGVTASFQVGSYWDPHLQIDVVVEREDRVTQLGECKWQNHLVGRTILPELYRKREFYPNPRNHTLQLMVFSRTGFTNALLREPDITPHTLREIYGV